VQTAITTTFKDIVEDSKTDVLLELCRPEVQDCAIVGSLLDQLAKLAINITTFKVVRIDVGANEVNAFMDVPHVPMVLFFPANNKTALSYNGVASMSNITDFVSKTASHPFSISIAAVEPEPVKPDRVTETANSETEALSHVANTLHRLQSNVM